ncbi:fluoride efflux transporter FluC [Loigolactobacillus jiayinensis]|uniref:Fluoride-specific ion channel FluC n=1 Tax=Loigolactobacillus jiayinensis TaxID=2486016 RepID=A0ABW1RE42_9LACO|nr:CrcB family protein [Loigolactobacillus jiayinensis]
MINFVLVGGGAALGACARYHLGELGKRYLSVNFPIVTLFLNISGSFILAYLFGHNLATPLYLFLGTGILGGYTTFSTFNSEMVLLWQQHRYQTMLLYCGSSYLCGLLAAIAGLWLATIK